MCILLESLQNLLYLSPISEKYSQSLPESFIEKLEKTSKKGQTNIEKKLGWIDQLVKRFAGDK